jgi:hypothetical protein
MKNRYEISGETTVIYLPYKGKNFETLIDSEDLAKISLKSWSYRKGYVTNMKTDPQTKKRINVPLPNFILGVGIWSKSGVVIDHIDGNPLNNRKNNLRVCKQKINMRNVKKSNRNTSSIYKGVCYHKRDSLYQSYLGLDRKHYSIGYYQTELEAGAAYNVLAKMLYGEFAHLNKIQLSKEQEQQIVTEIMSRKKHSKIKEFIREKQNL